MRAQCHIATVLLLLLYVSAQPARPTFSIGVLEAFNSSQHAKELDSLQCAASAVTDFSSRLSLPQWNTSWTPVTFEDKRQGPFLSMYPQVSQEQIAKGCDRLQWAYQRMLAAVAVTINMGLNYW